MTRYKHAPKPDHTQRWVWTFILVVIFLFPGTILNLVSPLADAEVHIFCNNGTHSPYVQQRCTGLR